MRLSIRNPEADALARRLAKLDDTTITEAVIAALREAIAARTRREPSHQTAGKILARRGLAFREGRRPPPGLRRSRRGRPSSSFRAPTSSTAVIPMRKAPSSNRSRPATSRAVIRHRRVKRSPTRSPSPRSMGWASGPSAISCFHYAHAKARREPLLTRDRNLRATGVETRSGGRPADAR